MEVAIEGGRHSRGKVPASIHKSMACARRVQSRVAYLTGRFSGMTGAVGTGDLRIGPAVTMLRREAMFGRRRRG